MTILVWLLFSWPNIPEVYQHSQDLTDTDTEHRSGTVSISHHINKAAAWSAPVKQNTNQTQYCTFHRQRSQHAQTSHAAFIYRTGETGCQLHDAVTSLLCCRQALRCGTVSGVGISLPVDGSTSPIGINSLWPAGAVGNFGAGPDLAFAML